MKNFRDLLVWRKAHGLVLSVHDVTSSFPSREQYELTTQIRRSGSFVAANIAEGCGRGSDADFGRCLCISMGSASEMEYHVLLAADLKLIDQIEYNRLDQQIQEVKRMLSSLIRKLKAES